MRHCTERFYNRFSFFYPLVDIFLKPQKRILFREINRLPKGNLLEVGVGNGAHLKLYQAPNVIGIDTSSKMLKKAAKRKTENVELLKMDGRELSFPDRYFDYVVLSHVVAVIDGPDQLLNEVFRVLKPGGSVFILNHFTPDNWLRHVDNNIGPLAKMLHLRSVFHINDLASINKFKLKNEIPVGFMSYFKLLIYQK